MEVCASDRAQVAQSYVRKRRVPAEAQNDLRKSHRSCGISAPLTAGFPHHLLRNAHGMMRARARTMSGGKCARYAAEMRMISCGPVFNFQFGHILC